MFISIYPSNQGLKRNILQQEGHLDLAVYLYLSIKSRIETTQASQRGDLFS